MRPALSSLFQSVPLEQEIRPLLIGERTNTNGSKKFRQLLLADDYEGCLQIALEQEAKGAHALDLCVAYTGRDEVADMSELVSLFAQSLQIPLVIDSTAPLAIEAALKLYPGRCIVNSINLEDGGPTLDRVCRLVKKYGAAVIALTIDETGMAMTVEKKTGVARRIHDLAVKKYGLRPSDLIFDPLTFTIGSGDESLKDAGLQTLAGIRAIKKELPGSFTSLGLSNLSFGLPPAARKILNSVFLHQAVAAGLDAAIIDTGKILPMAQIPAPDRQVCLDLIENRNTEEYESPLMKFVLYFETSSTAKVETKSAPGFSSGEQDIQQMLLTGSKEGLEDTLTILLQKYPALSIVNELLVPGMRYIGELFGRGEILLPFVLKSAEVMKKCVQFLEPFMERNHEDNQIKILLATVRGDVHDIGKNLVEIILSNNGYKVFNLGIKVPEQVIVQKALEYQADIVGLSGLLVKSAIIMQESMPFYQNSGLKTPILLGGAALTQRFVAQSCAGSYDQPVVYCSDAFAGLKAVRDFEQGNLKTTTYSATAIKNPGKNTINIEITRANPVPDPPFFGDRIITDISLDSVLPLINKQALFRGRWGYRRGKLSGPEYNDLIENKVEKIYQDLVKKCRQENLLRLKVAYGYFNCFSAGNELHIQHGDLSYIFQFPRQSYPPNLCISDFYKNESEGGDVAGFFVVTIGDLVSRETASLYRANAYHDYLMLHGFGVEVTDALAEYWHKIMRREMGIEEEGTFDINGLVTQQYQGSRYGFGYPSCPDLSAHKAVFELLRPDRIDVDLTESMEMVPEQTTSAIVAHHPQAKYFAV